MCSRTLSFIFLTCYARRVPNAKFMLFYLLELGCLKPDIDSCCVHFFVVKSREMMKSMIISPTYNNNFHSGSQRAHWTATDKLPSHSQSIE